MKLLHILSSLLFCLSFAASPTFADPAKVIIDTDFNTIGDDGRVAVMAAQLYAQGVIDLLGFTIPSGNQWRDQGVSDCLKAVERLGIENRVKVYVGAQYPLCMTMNLTFMKYFDSANRSTMSVRIQARSRVRIN
jgi:inosine-uridine nucleoside N-ribohydrolase